MLNAVWKNEMQEQRIQEAGWAQDRSILWMSAWTAKDTKRNLVSKHRKLKIKVKQIEFKIKPLNDEKYTESVR